MKLQFGAALLLLGAFLVCLSWVKLLIESPSNDDAEVRPSHFYLADPLTLYLRAARSDDTGPAQSRRYTWRLPEGMLITDAAKAYRWSDLGAAFLETGQTEKARYCYLRAAQLAPNSAETLLSVAVFYARAKQTSTALPYFGKILGYTYDFDETVFQDFEALKLDFDEIVAHGGMPAQLRPAASFLRYCITKNDLANARKVWAWMRSLSPNDQSAEQYIDFLLARKLTEEAATAWKEQLGAREEGYGKTTFLINGSFEREPAGTLFDWRIRRHEHVRALRDEEMPHSGHWSLRLDFDGREDVDYQGVSQRVFLQPGTYQLAAFLRTAGITTDQGVELRAFDAESPGRLMVETQAQTGTTDWKQVGATFVVASSTRLIEVQVSRHPSRRSEGSIAGSAWIDDVSFARAN